MADEEKRNYMVLIRLGITTPTVEHVRECMPKVRDLLQRISGGDYQLAFTTPDGSTCGFLLKTGMYAGQIGNALRGENDDPRPSILLSDDGLLVMELGRDFTGWRFTRAWNWIQHR